MNQQRVILTDVFPVEVAPSGNPYFTATFKHGRLGKPVTRSFWGRHDEDGLLRWDRIAPEELATLKGRDLSGEVSIEAVEIEPEEFVVPSTGELRLLRSRTVVRFADETLEQAVRRAGSVLRATAASGHPIIPDPVKGPFAIPEALERVLWPNGGLPTQPG